MRFYFTVPVYKMGQKHGGYIGCNEKLETPNQIGNPSGWDIRQLGVAESPFFFLRRCLNLAVAECCLLYTRNIWPAEANSLDTLCRRAFDRVCEVHGKPFPFQSITTLITSGVWANNFIGKYVFLPSFYFFLWILHPWYWLAAKMH